MAQAINFRKIPKEITMIIQPDKPERTIFYKGKEINAFRYEPKGIFRTKSILKAIQIVENGEWININ